MEINLSGYNFHQYSVGFHYKEIVWKIILLFNPFIMSNESVEETLRRSREVDERYKKFLKEKEESDKQWAITEAQIEKTLNKLSETK